MSCYLRYATGLSVQVIFGVSAVRFHGRWELRFFWREQLPQSVEGSYFLETVSIVVGSEGVSCSVNLHSFEA